MYAKHQIKFDKTATLGYVGQIITYIYSTMNARQNITLIKNDIFLHENNCPGHNIYNVANSHMPLLL